MLTSSDFLTLICIMLLGPEKNTEILPMCLFGRSTYDFLLKVLQKLM